MSTEPQPNGAARPETVQQLRERVAEDRRELTETVAALHHKTDVKEQAQEKAVDVEMAAADFATRAGRAAAGAVGFVRWTGIMTAERARSMTPRPVRARMERLDGPAGRELRLFLAATTAIVAAAAAGTVRRMRQHASSGSCRRR